MSELFTSLPRHLYCYVERKYLGVEKGLERCSWFGLTSVRDRAWGLTLLLENGAIYSHVPPNAITWYGDLPDPPAWPLFRAQLWDCFGERFAVHCYEQLDGRDVDVRIPARPGYPKWRGSGRYLFTAQHYGDAYSRVPEQAKQFHFIELTTGRLTCLPANCILVHDRAFTTPQWPKWLRRQEETYECE